jgi:hypothetical protein
MDQQFQPLLQLLDQLSDEFVELRDGVRKAIRIADHDPEMALTRTRKVLEYIVRDVYGRRCNEKPGTQPLENLLQRLSKDGYVPKRVSAYANAIRDLGNVGTHTFGEGVSMDDVRQSLGQLVPVLEWYVKVERPDAVTTTNERRRDSTRDAGIESAKRRSSPRKELYRQYFNTLRDEMREKGEKGSIVPMCTVFRRESVAFIITRILVRVSASVLGFTLLTKRTSSRRCWLNVKRSSRTWANL